MLSQTCGQQRVDSLFIGGGTPTLLPQTMLANIITDVLDLFAISDHAEVSVEANPGSVDQEYCRDLLRVGATRLSLGVQSFDDQDLKILGRIHTAVEAVEAFKSARRAGFSNINLDLMYGLPGQTLRSWETTLRRALRLQPEHLSLYQLTLETDTPLWSEVYAGKLILPSDEEIVAMDEMSENLCRSSGLVQYEIANFAREGCRCQHNLNYWHNREYWACGAGAVSFVNGKREKRIADPFAYIGLIEAGVTPVVECEQLSLEASFRETVVMSLRLTEGLELVSLLHRYGIDVRAYYHETLYGLVQRKLLEVTATHVRLTRLGRGFANLVMRELV